jgi:hypothetical protein
MKGIGQDFFLEDAVAAGWFAQIYEIYKEYRNAKF